MVMLSFKYLIGLFAFTNTILSIIYKIYAFILSIKCIFNQQFNLIKFNNTQKYF